MVSVIDLDVSGLDGEFPENLEDDEPPWRELDEIYGLVQHGRAVERLRGFPGVEIVNEMEEIVWKDEDGTFEVELLRCPQRPPASFGGTEAASPGADATRQARRFGRGQSAAA
ncbi:MAG: hypothetical protein OXQ29_18640 [Rhodospirillaceae bacterium]|nr:hypothetical protein [Rhodospirillaceae bacterium]